MGPSNKKRSLAMFSTPLPESERSELECELLPHPTDLRGELPASHQQVDFIFPELQCLQPWFENCYFIMLSSKQCKLLQRETEHQPICSACSLTCQRELTDLSPSLMWPPSENIQALLKNRLCLASLFCLVRVGQGSGYVLCVFLACIHRRTHS